MNIEKVTLEGNYDIFYFIDATPETIFFIVDTGVILHKKITLVVPREMAYSFIDAFVKLKKAHVLANSNPLKEEGHYYLTLERVGLNNKLLISYYPVNDYNGKCNLVTDSNLLVNDSIDTELFSSLVQAENRIVLFGVSNENY